MVAAAFHTVKMRVFETRSHFGGRHSTNQSLIRSCRAPALQYLVRA
jgi:hypothetical protein